MRLSLKSVTGWLLPFLFTFTFAGMAPSFGRQSEQSELLLAKDGKAYVNIWLPASGAGSAGETAQFAARELAAYLKKISGATFGIHPMKGAEKVSGATATKASIGRIMLLTDTRMDEEAYRIKRRSSGVLELAGGSERAVLFAVYDFLEQLGCRWIAPAFSFYKGASEFIPSTAQLSFKGADRYRSPRFKYRKLCIEEGLTHTIENLQELIDWMPKLGFNTFMTPLDYGGSGRVKWDNWRRDITPELKKRSLLIEVGGHGYQNFIHPRMEGGTLFEKHPEWFGLDTNCNPSDKENLVFNTFDSGAVGYLTRNVARYLAERPEINVFDFWPPDMARWQECKSDAHQIILDPLDRQAGLVNHVADALKKVRPDITLEMIAYQPVLGVPPHAGLSADVLVDFCPINQCFEYQIYDSLSGNNLDYVRHLRAWREKFKGDIGLYAYYRKYGWNSLPAVLPRYIQKDLAWYAASGLQGISCYAEPGDWFTYELTMYSLGKSAWDPAIDMDTLIQSYCAARFGPYATVAEEALTFLEKTVPRFGSLPYSKLKAANQIEAASGQLGIIKKKIQGAKKEALNASSGRYIQAREKLLLMLQYADYDLEIQTLRALTLDTVKVAETTERLTNAAIFEKVSELNQFLRDHKEEGVFLDKKMDAEKRMKRQYTKLY